MSNENPANEPAPKLPALRAGGVPSAIVAHSFDDAWRIANAVVASGMAPSDFNTPEKAMVAIMHGAEVGLPPMQALQSIAVINGRPTIWGDGALGLVRSSGVLEGVRERIDRATDGKMTAICEVKRKGEADPIIRTFSQDDAVRAGLWNKRGRSGGETPWVTYPQRMLQMRARSWALRDAFADVLKGLQIREEVEDYQPTGDKAPAPEAPPPPPPPAPAEPIIDAEFTETPARESPAPAPQEAAPAPEPPTPGTPEEIAAAVRRGLETCDGSQFKSPPQPQTEEVRQLVKNSPNAPAKTEKELDPEAFRKEVETRVKGCTTGEELESYWNDHVAPRTEDMFPPDREDLLGIYRKRERELEP